MMTSQLGDAPAFTCSAPAICPTYWPIDYKQAAHSLQQPSDNHLQLLSTQPSLIYSQHSDVRNCVSHSISLARVWITDYLHDDLFSGASYAPPLYTCIPTPSKLNISLLQHCPEVLFTPPRNVFSTTSRLVQMLLLAPLG
jgi:hypothetical protein